MAKDDNLSMPRFRADLNVLCVDGTRATDSAAFFNYLQIAGRKSKVNVQNLLSLVESGGGGTIRLPAGDPGTVFPFGPDYLKTLPIEKEALPGSSKRIAYVLLPHGEVTGAKNDFSDSALGASPTERSDAALRNSELLKRLCLGPGVSQVGSPSAHLDFATGGDDNVGTDILYLSGHGSMAGAISGEESLDLRLSNLHYFELLLLLRPEFAELARSVTPPLWMVIGSCFSMRPAHGQVWLRIFKDQDVTLRGILGYQTTSPLADVSAEINRRFAAALGEGDTFIMAWQKANGSNEKWTALAFDHAKDDTLASLRDLKRGTTPRNIPTRANRVLQFYEQGRSVPVQIEPPPALLEVRHWDIAFGYMPDPGQRVPPPVGEWDKVLITNLDFTEEKFKQAIEAPKWKDKLANNGSWKACRQPQSLLDIQGAWQHKFCAGRLYEIRLFPPFHPKFTAGYLEGDQFELSLVHVRQNYTKMTAAFRSVFDVLQINGRNVHPSVVSFLIPPPDKNPKKQSGTVWNRIRFPCPPTRSEFEPARLTVRFKAEASARHYHWFWFGVRIERAGETAFENDFDTFIMTPKTHGCELMDPKGPMPPEDIWGAPP